MSQPLAIYASIPPTDPSSPNWLNTAPNLVPLSVADAYDRWPNLDWQIGGIDPIVYSEIPDYLWNPSTADVTDGANKQFTRRIPVTLLPSFSAVNIPTGVYRFVLSVAADDQYQVQLLYNGVIIGAEQPNPGFNFAVPAPFAWRNVKTFVYGTIAGLTLAVVGSLDIQINANNIPQPVGTPPELNPAMFTWILQVFAAVSA